MMPLIKRNTLIPTQKAMIFSTSTDNQSTVAIQVVEGEGGGEGEGEGGGEGGSDNHEYEVGEFGRSAQLNNAL